MAEVIRVNFKEALERKPRRGAAAVRHCLRAEIRNRKAQPGREQYVRRMLPFSISAGFSYIFGGAIIGF